MIGGGYGAKSVEVYNVRAPIEIQLHGFDHGKRFRAVIVSLPLATRFHFNFRTGTDIAFHFNPRFDEKATVSNSTHGGHWMHEERTNMPFNRERVYTVDFVANHGRIQVLINGAPFTEFVERNPGQHINLVEIGGDVHVHSAYVL